MFYERLLKEWNERATATFQKIIIMKYVKVGKKCEMMALTTKNMILIHMPVNYLD